MARRCSPASITNGRCQRDVHCGADSRSSAMASDSEVDYEEEEEHHRRRRDDDTAGNQSDNEKNTGERNAGDDNGAVNMHTTSDDDGAVTKHASWRPPTSLSKLKWDIDIDDGWLKAHQSHGAPTKQNMAEYKALMPPGVTEGQIYGRNSYFRSPDVALPKSGQPEAAYDALRALPREQTRAKNRKKPANKSAVDDAEPNPNTRPGDWECPSCNANNYANRTWCFPSCCITLCSCLFVSQCSVLC